MTHASTVEQLDHYQRWLLLCQKHCQTEAKETSDYGKNKCEALNANGFTHINCLTSIYANNLIEEIELHSQKRSTRNSLSYDYHLNSDVKKKVIRKILSEVTNNGLDDLLKHHFRSNYFFYFLTLSSSQFCNENHGYSERWHRDACPSSAVKLLIYLNGPDEHNGNTLLYDKGRTDFLSSRGYAFPPLAQRQSDLSPYFQGSNLEPQPTAKKLDAGIGLLFSPQTVLHKGQFPTEGIRWVLTLFIQPSPIPWQDTLDTWNEDYLHGRDIVFNMEFAQMIMASVDKQ